MKNVYLAASVRTPIGRFGGTLASWTAADLGVATAKASLERARLRPDQIQQSIWGCARQAGGGPNVARQITYRAGVPDTVPAFTVNQACGSSLQAIFLAAQQIVLGRAEVVLLTRQELGLTDIDLVELNEAFAAQVIACDRELGLDQERLNTNGGAIALGHPIGCTGVRITTTLLHEMKKRDARLGLSTLCVSGGMGLAMLVERV